MTKTFKEYYQARPEVYRKHVNDYYARLRRQVIDHYGGHCKCCGESDIRFLSIDHIDGGGRQHREQLGKSAGGRAIYMWLRKNNFPEGFQILCHNCNFAKGHYGECPHQQGVWGLLCQKD